MHTPTKRTFLIRLFLVSCAIILSLTAVAKIVSANGHATILLNSDPLLKVRNRELLYAVAGAELVVVFFLCFGRDLLAKVLSVTWLSSAFVAYRIGSAALGIKLCPCLGNITDNLPIRPEVANGLLISSLGYMFVCSIFFSVQLFRERKTMGNYEKAKPDLAGGGLLQH